MRGLRQGMKFVKVVKPQYTADLDTEANAPEQESVKDFVVWSGGGWLVG